MKRAIKTRESFDSPIAFEHELTLGHFSLPHVNGRCGEFSEFASERHNATTAAIPGRNLAFNALPRPGSRQNRVHRGFNAETDKSTMLFAYRKRTPKNAAMELMTTAMLHKAEDSATVRISSCGSRGPHLRCGESPRTSAAPADKRCSRFRL